MSNTQIKATPDWCPDDFGFDRIADLPRYKRGKYRLHRHPNDVWVMFKNSTNKAGQFELVTTFYLQIKPNDVLTICSVLNTVKELDISDAIEKFSVFFPELKKLPNYDSRQERTQNSDTISK